MIPASKENFCKFTAQFPKGTTVRPILGAFDKPAKILGFDERKGELIADVENADGRFWAYASDLRKA